MKINVQIERLILDGIDLAPHERPLLPAAVEGELGRLMMAGGVNAELAVGCMSPVRGTTSSREMWRCRSSGGSTPMN